MMAKDLTPVPSPKGDGCLLAKVNAFPLAAKRLGDFVRELQSKSGGSCGPQPYLVEA